MGHAVHADILGPECVQNAFCGERASEDEGARHGGRDTAAQYNTLHHTATYCNAPQHTRDRELSARQEERETAGHHTTLQHTATRCTTLQHARDRELSARKGGGDTEISRKYRDCAQRGLAGVMTERRLDGDGGEGEEGRRGEGAGITLAEKSLGENGAREGEGARSGLGRVGRGGGRGLRASEGLGRGSVCGKNPFSEESMRDTIFAMGEGVYGI